MSHPRSQLDEYLCKPIIIVGAPRSGTTLMGKVLSRHPDLEYLMEPRMTWRYGNDRKSDMLKPSDARPEVIDRYYNPEFQRYVTDKAVSSEPANDIEFGGLQN